MKSIQTIDKHKRFENEILHSKKSNIKLNEKTFLSDSESASPAASIIDILNETKQRLDNLQVETQLVEENYDKHCIQTSVRYADLWRTTQIVANQNVSTSTHTTDKVETLNEHALTDYERVKNDSTHDVKVGTEDELQQIPEPPQFGASKLPPLFEELHTNILSSFQNFQSTVLEVSRDLNTFVQSTSKLSDNLIKPKSDTLQQEHKINLKAKELESSFLPLNDIENDIMDDFISKIDPLTDRGWYRLENEKTASVPTFKTANSKIDAPLINNDWFFRLENEKTSHVSSSVQTFDSINVSKSIQTLDNVDFVKSDDQLQNKPYQNEEEFKLDIYETNSMEFIYEQNMEDNQSGHYSGNGIQSQLEIIQEIVNMENNNTKTIETENISEVKEVGSEYVIEPFKAFSLPLQCDAGSIEDQTKNYSPSNHSTKPICSRHSDIDQATSSKNYNNSEYSRMNEPTNSKHDSDSIISQVKDQEETNNTASHSLQNIIESLVNKVYSSTEDIVAIIDDKDKKQQEKEQLVHILEQISIEDIPNNKSSNSNTNSLNSPISTGFDNKNDDFWM
ncbi:MATH and LRR domain-containing protein PFE0570w-like [Chrysoperla carnea]|uniref:MATH and LRR domain-containing protein PFE0570w-like n=1 Tax=Chrysoperla carnea TaxID=189513 RepID=UPI001D068C88|nr:MATH and LRR domain-containing protein PFE0570w-like [Chrysoperla carnea]